MLSELVELRTYGKMTDSNGFKASDLGDVSKILQTAGFPFDGKQIRSKFDDLKKIWREWQRHLGRVSGWGRDPLSGAPVNTKEVEDEYFHKHESSRAFRKKAPPFHDLLEELLGDSGPSGSYAKDIDDVIAGV